MLSAFIAGAKKDLAIYDAKVHDPSIIKLLKERAAKGVKVRVLGDMKGKDPGIEERRLADAAARARHRSRRHSARLSAVRACGRTSSRTAARSG